MAEGTDRWTRHATAPCSDSLICDVSTGSHHLKCSRVELENTGLIKREISWSASDRQLTRPVKGLENLRRLGHHWGVREWPSSMAGPRTSDKVLGAPSYGPRRKTRVLRVAEKGTHTCCGGRGHGPASLSRHLFWDSSPQWAYGRRVLPSALSPSGPAPPCVTLSLSLCLSLRLSVPLHRSALMPVLTASAWALCRQQGPLPDGGMDLS